MARVALALDEQIELLKTAQQALGFTQAQMAHVCQVHCRTFSDWRRGKYRMRYEALERLVKMSGISIGQDVGSVPEFSHVRAAARLGGLRRDSLYGNPGTPEGRRLGGFRSIAKRYASGDPWIPPDGFRVGKFIRRPDPSPELAEFMGILLGDGCLSSAFQAALYFNAQTDAEYAEFMKTFAFTLFGIAPRQTREVGGNGGTLLFSSKQLVEYLIQLGFPRGDKVKNQTGVPEWILRDTEYRRSCLRGLMDTDGSVYRYEHCVYGRSYVHLAVCFTNRSHPLLRFVRETLATNGYHPTATEFRIYLHRRREVERYFSEVGTHNSKHLRKYQAYADSLASAAGRGAGVVDPVALEKR